MVQSRRAGSSYHELKGGFSSIREEFRELSILHRWAKVTHGFLELVRRHNHIFIRPTLIALIPTVLAVLLKWYQISGDVNIPEGVFPESPLAYTSLNWVLGFVLVFRANQAYNRFWDAAVHLHLMTTEFSDAVAQVFAFTESSDASRRKKDAFRVTMARLFSLLHGVALQQVTDIEDDNIKVIDPGGIGEEQLKYLQQFGRNARSTVVMQWLLRAITEGVKSGVVNAPAPIVTRVFNECNSGMIALARMKMLVELPFPVPYSKMLYALLGVHLFMTPFYAAAFTNARFWAGIYSFVTAFSLWSIQCISQEIEQPFADGIDDLDLPNSQKELNDSLITLLYPQTQWAPDLDQITPVEVQRPLYHIACQKLSKSKTLDTLETLERISIREAIDALRAWKIGHHDAEHNSLPHQTTKSDSNGLPHQTRTAEAGDQQVGGKCLERESSGKSLSNSLPTGEKSSSPQDEDGFSVSPLAKRKQHSEGRHRLTERGCRATQEQSNNKRFPEYERDRTKNKEGASGATDDATHVDIPLEVDVSACASGRTMPQLHCSSRQRELTAQILQSNEHCIALFNSVTHLAVQPSTLPVALKVHKTPNLQDVQSMGSAEAQISKNPEPQLPVPSLQVWTDQPNQFPVSYAEPPSTPPLPSFHSLSNRF